MWDFRGSRHRDLPRRDIDRDHGPLWIVKATRGDLVIRCRADRAVEAWGAAVEIAERLG